MSRFARLLHRVLSLVHSTVVADRLSAALPGAAQPALARAGSGSRRTIRLLPAEVRRQRFQPARLGQRGLDPEDVQRFLNRVAEEMSALYRDVAAAHDQASRMRDALREWQTQHAARPTGEATRPHRPAPHPHRRTARPYLNSRFARA